MKNSIVLIILITIMGSCQGISPHDEVEHPPNIVFIYADDLGYGDVSCYGSDSIHTPYLDELAQKGARFTDFYSASPVCSPSRVALLTGRYPVRAGITRVFFPNSLQGIDSAEITLPEILKEAGYTTGIIGKWHLGHLPPYLPGKHGFDYWFGLPYSNDMTWEPRNDPPLPLMRNGKIVDQPTHQATLTQRYSAEAFKFIAKNREVPFFLYIPHTFPHKPLYVSAEYEGTSLLGRYGDVVQELDRSVGEVMKALDEFDLLERTIVVFSSDNGPAKGAGGKTGGLRGHKATTFEGGIRVPTLAFWSGKIPEGSVIQQPAIMMDWMPTFAHIAKADLPENLPLDGQDITPFLLGTAEPMERDFYFYFNEDLRALRSGKWKFKKAVMDNPYRQRLEPHHDLLFDLESDPNETTNLINTHQHVADKMKNKMERFKQSLGSAPEPKLKAIPFNDPRK